MLDGWGTICNTKFDNQDAKVACRMMGFNDGEQIESS